LEKQEVGDVVDPELHLEAACGLLLGHAMTPALFKRTFSVWLRDKKSFAASRTDWRLLRSATTTSIG
jgi:hypothetical protein